MDATLVEAQVKRPPMSAGPGAKSTRDPDADWSRTGRGSRTHFGYKAHIGVDAGTGLVRMAVLTPAKVYESEVADDLISGDERAVYGDRAYESKGAASAASGHGDQGQNHASGKQASSHVAASTPVTE